jgi:hypothetical protein
VEVLYEKKISALCVMQGDALEGIITSTDMLAVLIQLLGQQDAKSMTAGD